MADLLKASGATVRATDALLRGVGGRAVLLRVPAPAIPGDATEQLGLAAPQFQDVELAPVVILTGTTKGTKSLLISATAVNGIVGSLGYSSVSVLFAVAYGVLVDDALLEIISMTEQEVRGTPYMYRVSVREPAKLAV